MVSAIVSVVHCGCTSQCVLLLKHGFVGFVCMVSDDERWVELKLPVFEVSSAIVLFCLDSAAVDS